MNLKEILQKAGLEDRHVLYDSDNTHVFGGPHKKLHSLSTIDNIEYLRAVTPDDMTGYYRRDNTAAFGSPHAEVIGFIEINEMKYLRARGEDGKEGLYDSDGELFNKRKYDVVESVSTPLDELVLFIMDGDKQGFLLSDCSLFGKKNAMHSLAELRKVGDEVCLWSRDEEGKECYYSRKGKPMYGGKHEQTEIRKIGEEFCLWARDEDGRECLYSRKNEELFGGKHDKIDAARKLDDEFYVIVHDEEGAAVVSRDGKTHFGGYHVAEAEDDPHTRGVHCIDEETLIKFVVDEDGMICYYRFNGDQVFGGPHDGQCEEWHSVLGRTVLKFEDGDKQGYYDINGKRLFGGEHEEEVKENSFSWKGKTYICFKDAGRFRYFGFSGRKKIFSGYHDEVHGILRVSFEGEEGSADLLFLKAFERPESFWGRLGLRKKYTHYSLDGESFDSEKAIREHYGIPDDASFRTLKATDTVAIPAFSVGKRHLEEVLAEAEQQKEKADETAEQGEEEPEQPDEPEEEAGPEEQ